MQAAEPLIAAERVAQPPAPKEGRLPQWLNTENASILAFYALAGIAWEVFGHDVDPYFSSYPSAIIRALSGLVQSGEVGNALGSSLGVLALGLGYTFLIGLPLGYGIGRFRTVDAIVGPIVTAFFVAPRVVFVPLLVVWFGLSDTSRITLVVLSGIFPLIYNVADGVRSLSAAYVDVAHAYGASEWQVVREVTVPAILPFIGAGAQQSIVRAMTGLVVAEFFIGLTGLGGLLEITSENFEMDKSLAVIAVLVAVGFCLTKIGDSIEAYLSRWRKTERAFGQ